MLCKLTQFVLRANAVAHERAIVINDSSSPCRANWLSVVVLSDQIAFEYLWTTILIDLTHGTVVAEEKRSTGHSSPSLRSASALFLRILQV